LALESDQSQPVDWSADGDSTMRVEAGTRIFEMSNNVKVTQGTLKIFGNEAIIEIDATTDKLNRVTVHGTPVHYQQQLDEDGTLVTGTSKTIIFYLDELTDETTIELVGDANIESPDTTWNCAAITYIVERNLIPRSTGPCKGRLTGSNQ
jgi:lipopolysaccharide transport protein LptA